MAGLLSLEATAQDKAPATNAPAAVPPTNAAPAAAKPAEAPEKGQLSYALGMFYAQGITNDMMRGKTVYGLEPKVDLEISKFVEAFSNMVSGVPTTMAIADVTKIMQQQDAYHKEKIQEEIKKLTALGPENKTKGESYLEMIGSQSGVTKLSSGVVYKVIKEGEGDKPATSDRATVSWQATLIDGTEVWKIDHQLAPLTPIPQIPPGVTEAMNLMKPGSHWTIYLPPSQAFGDRPSIPDPIHGYKVGPESALIFDLTLESVQHPPAQPAGLPQGMPPGMRSGGPMMMPPNTVVAPPVTSSSIVRVPSAEDMAKGEKPRVLTDAEIEAAKADAAKAAQTNTPTPK